MNQLRIPLDSGIDFFQLKPSEMDAREALALLDQAASLPLWQRLTSVLQMASHSSSRVRRGVTTQLEAALRPQVVLGAEAPDPQLAIELSDAIDRAYDSLNYGIQVKLASATYRVL